MLITASTNSTINAQSNQVLIGINSYSPISGYSGPTIGAPGLFIGNGTSAIPSSTNNGIGIAAYIETPGTPSIGIVTANKFLSPFADYGEYFEWEDNNTSGEDRRGLFVTFSDSAPDRFVS